MRRADQDVVEPVAIDVAERRDRIAAHVADAGRIGAADAYRPSRVSIGEPGVAEDNVSLALLAVIVWRGYHEIADPVAIEVACIRDSVAGLRAHGVRVIVVYADPHVEYTVG